VEIATFPVTPFVENCFVLKDDNEALVVDPGEAAPEILRSIEGRNVRLIVNTHCHCDHCGGNAGLVEKTGAELAIHEAELPLLRSLDSQGQMFGCYFPPSPDPDRFLKDGDTIDVGAITLKVVHAPGHSPGHIILVGEEFVIAGDVLFAGSIGRTDLPGGSYHELLESIRTKLLSLPDETIVYCGHGPKTTIGTERRSNPFLVGL